MSPQHKAYRPTPLVLTDASGEGLGLPKEHDA